MKHRSEIDNSLSLIHTSTSAFVKLMIYLKISTSQCSIFLIFCALLKFYGCLIITIKDPFIGGKLRKITLFDFYTQNITFKVYNIISAILFSIEIIFVLCIIQFYICLRRKKRINKCIGAIFKSIFYFNVLMSQHIIEHFGLIILFWLHPEQGAAELPPAMDKGPNEGGMDMPDMGPPEDQPMYFYNGKVFDFDRSNKGMFYAYITVNMLMCLFVLVVYFFSYFIINTPFLKKKAAMQFRHHSFLFFTIICQLIFSFEYLDLYLPNSIRNQYTNCCNAFFFIICIILIATNIKNTEAATASHYFYIWFVLFILSSTLLNTSLSVSFSMLNKVKTIYVIVLKLFISIILLFLFYLCNDKIMHKLCSKSLFTIYEESSSLRTFYVESFYYLLIKMRPLKEENKNQYIKKDCICSVVELLLTHNEICKNENCKCRLIKKKFPTQYHSKSKIKQHLLKTIGFLFETAFIKINYTHENCLPYAILLAQYFFEYKHNSILAYSIIHSSFNANKKDISFYDMIKIYFLLYELIFYCKDIYSKDESYVDFNNIINEQKIFKKFDFLLCDYCNYANKVVSLKETIDTSLNFNYGYDNEILSITSKHLNQQSLQNLIEWYKKQHMLYNKIEDLSLNSKTGENSYIYLFKMSLFFQLVNSTVPQIFLKKISHLVKKNNMFIGYNTKEINQKLDEYIKQTLKQNTENKHYIILKCNKGIRIKYFSIQLCKILGYVHNNIIKEKLEALFPPSFQKHHQKAVMNFLTQNKDIFYIERPTYIFDSNYYSLPCFAKVAILPHLSKHLSIICEITLEPKNNSLTFFANKYHEILSLSRTIWDKLSLSLDIINKYKINLFDIFDINNDINRSFNQFDKKVNLYVQKLPRNTKNIISRYFYQDNKMEEDSKGPHFKNLKLNKDIIESEFDDHQSIEFSRKFYKNRSYVLHNLIKILNQFSEIELKDELREKLGEIYYRFKENTFSSKGDTSSDDLFYTIRITAKLLYNYPIYIVDMKLSFKKSGRALQRSSIRRSSNHIFKTTIAPLNVKFLEGNVQYEYTDSEVSQFTLESKLFLKSSKNLGNFQLESTKNLCTIPMKYNDTTPKSQKDLISINQKTEKPKIIKQRQRKRTVFELRTMMTIITSGIVAICTALCIYYIHDRSKYFKVFSYLLSCIFSNSVQRDKYSNLVSSFFTIVSRLSNMLESPYEIDVYYSKSNNTTILFEESFTSFYSSYIKYNVLTNNDFTEILEELNYTKITGNFIPINYYSDFIPEVYNLYYSTFKFIREPVNTYNIMYDIVMIYNFTFRKYEKQAIKSELGSLFYYIVFNSDNFNKVIDNIENRMNRQFNTLIKEMKNKTYICEGIVLTLLGIVLGDLFYLIKRSNQMIFYNLISIITVYNNNDRNINANAMLNQKMNLFTTLINNFTLENYNNYKEMKPVTSTPTKSENSSSFFDKGYNDINPIPTNTSNTSSMQTHQTNNRLLSTSKTASSRHLPALSLMNKMNNSNLKSNLVPKRMYIKEAKTSKLITPSLFTLRWIKIFIYFYIILIAYFVFNILCLLFRVNFTIIYLDNLELINKFFVILSSKFSIITESFNSLRQSHYTDMVFKEMSIHNQTENDNYINSNLHKFPYTSRLWNEAQKKIDDETINLDTLCRHNEICIEVAKEGSYLADGIILGLQALTQRLFQAITELSQVPTEQLGFSYVYKYLKKNNLSILEREVEFVVQHIQATFHKAFYYDYLDLKRKYENIVYIINFVSIIVSIMFICIVIFVLNIKIRNLYKTISFGSEKLKQLFLGIAN